MPPQLIDGPRRNGRTPQLGEPFGARLVALGLELSSKPSPLAHERRVRRSIQRGYGVLIAAGHDEDVTCRRTVGNAVDGRHAWLPEPELGLAMPSRAKSIRPRLVSVSAK